MNIKIKGENEGFKAENLIEKYLNNKKINELSETNLKKLILLICNDNNIEVKKNTKIKVNEIDRNKIQIKGSPKTDRIFLIDSNQYRISIKTGEGGSFHQEPRNSFVKFLKENTSIEENIIKFLDKFLLDKKIKIKNSILSKFFKENKLILINRVLSGRFNEPSIDYYIFCPKLKSTDNEEQKIIKIEKCKYIKKNNLINYLNTHESTGSCPVGRLTFQAYNRNRGTDIQFKWGTCYDDIK